MEFAAHILEDGSIQTVEDHCKETAENAARYAAGFNMHNVAYLQGSFMTSENYPRNSIVIFMVNQK